MISQILSMLCCLGEGLPRLAALGVVGGTGEPRVPLGRSPTNRVSCTAFLLLGQRGLGVLPEMHCYLLFFQAVSGRNLQSACGCWLLVGGIGKL